MNHASTFPANDQEPTRFLLAAPAGLPPTLTPFSLPVIKHPNDPDSRADVLARIRIMKTVKPGLRVVLFDGSLVGKIAQCPWGPGWLASSTRARIFWSQDDAALALLEGVLP